MLLGGDELRDVFKIFCPFDGSGRLLPEQERRTVLAANANMPVEIFGRALVMAASAGDGSPLIVQLSHTALRSVGGSDDTIRPVQRAARLPYSNPLTSGAILASSLIDEFTEHYGAQCVAISLDHFKVPSFQPGLPSRATGRKVARARIDEASDAMPSVLRGDARPAKELVEQYVDYLCSEEYAAFKRDFLAVVRAISPAWGMIDTERLPPLLDFAVTREVSEAVREDLGNTSMMLEAEYGATGQSGKALPYAPLLGSDLERFAEEVAAFVAYTDADGIAYPIGMEHAAKTAESHEPDVRRLEVVQSRIYHKTGRYVPFAQHGGTGAARLAKGLVGKNNINTRFLVVAAASFAEWVAAHREGIMEGEKKSSGTDMYAGAIRRIAEECVAKLEETGAFGESPDCIAAMTGDPATTREGKE
jgi:fructose/tagatose bisphosphate aldolase